ncbi:MAG: uroporphyrinogen-III synthase [Gammaproteobacteria bacterium]|nr:uroporphyrinogen-III synthase [Gammaproteobacteria bacterium]
MNALRGQHCIVLRPAPEGQALAAQLRELGLVTRHFPTLEIQPLAGVSLPGTPPDLLIFISPNAVRHGAATLGAAPVARVAAIGSATAAALAQAGRPPDILPANNGYDSEALLATDALADVAGRRIWIVRGAGGRALLGDTLLERGAQVRYVEVYERTPVQPDEQTLGTVRAALTGGSDPWVVATSVETLANLYRLLGDAALRYRLVTASDRVVKLAQQHDRVNLVLKASGPDPMSLAHCLRHWASHEPTPSDPP